MVNENEVNERLNNPTENIANEVENNEKVPIIWQPWFWLIVVFGLAVAIIVTLGIQKAKIDARKLNVNNKNTKIEQVIY